MSTIVMDTIQRAFLLHQEADLILNEIRFHEILAPFGPLTFTGSYSLDLMAWPDIDVEIPQMSMDQIFDVLIRFFGHPWVDKIELEKPNDPRLPGGQYFMLRILHGNWERPWKIDLWSLPQPVLENNIKDMRHLKSLITPEKREIILNYKVARLNLQGRTPPGSGWWIYKAVLEEGMEKEEQIDAYLDAKGILL